MGRRLCTQPLVSIVIATYNRRDLLINRALKSISCQTYANIEVVIVDDGSTDDTEYAVKSIQGMNIKYKRIHRSKHKEGLDNKSQWMVMSSFPLNLGMSIASGDVLAILDDDDEYYLDHIEKCVSDITTKNAEFVYGKRLIEIAPSEWQETGAKGAIAHSSVAFVSYLRCFRYSTRCYLIDLVADHERWLRMEKSGVRMVFNPHLAFKAALRPGTTAQHYQSEDFDR